MADRPKELLPMLEPDFEDFSKLSPLELPGNAEISYRRVDAFVLLHQHQSMSNEVANVRIQEAIARKEQARFEHSVPAEEETKRAREHTTQVIVVGIVVAVVVLVGVIGVVLKPEAGTSIAAIVSVCAGVFGIGSVYAVSKLQAKATKPTG